MTEDDYQPGSRADFDRLYEATYPRLVRTVYGIVGSVAAAEDCVQDGFLKAFAAWPRYRPDRPAEAWIHQIVVNTAISYRRRMRLREVGEVMRRLGRPSEGRDPGEAAAGSDVVKAMAALPPKVSATFLLRHHHGYSIREISELQGISERMVGFRLNRARAELARRLGPEWGEALPKTEVTGVSHTEIPG